MDAQCDFEDTQDEIAILESELEDWADCMDPEARCEAQVEESDTKRIPKGVQQRNYSSTATTNNNGDYEVKVID